MCLQDPGLPDAGVSVLRARSASPRHVADELPRVALVCAGVEINVGAVPSPAVAAGQNSAGGKVTDGPGELGNGRMGTHAESIDLVCHVGDPLP